MIMKGVQRTKLKDRILPGYTHAEELMNMITHIVGGAIGIAVLVLCVVFGAMRGDPYRVVSASIFGSSMVVLYTMSSIYHGLSPKLMAKKVFQVIDHCSVFFLIAGTYTPICLVGLREYSTALGWTMFGVIWAAAALGCALNGVDLKKYSKFSMVCYLCMGWCIILTARLLPGILGWNGVAMLISGGIAYTIGAGLYVVGKRKPYAHSVFHIFVVIGSLLHAMCIMLYLMR